MTDRYRKAMEKAEKKMDKQKAAQRKKAGKILAKDFGRSTATCTFYINHDYDHPYDQAEWTKLHKKLSLANDPEAFVPMYNAIVVDCGYYVRRGLERLNHSGMRFVPGENDEVSYIYAVEPYTYKK